MHHGNSQPSGQYPLPEHFDSLKNAQLIKDPQELRKLEHPGSLKILDDFLDRLLLIFKNYCSFGDPMNTTRMKSMKFVKLLKNSKLLSHNNKENAHREENQIDIEDVDLIFVKINALKPNKNQKTLEFEHFLLALEQVAIKIFRGIDVPEALIVLLQNYILPLVDQDYQTEKPNNQGEHVQILMSILQDHQIVEILGLLHKAIINFYKVYSDNHFLMNFDK